VVRSFGTANGCLRSAGTAHDVAVSRHGEGVTGLAFPVTSFDGEVRCLGVPVRAQRLEVTCV